MYNYLKNLLILLTEYTFYFPTKEAFVTQTIKHKNLPLNIALKILYILWKVIYLWLLLSYTDTCVEEV